MKFKNILLGSAVSLIFLLVGFGVCYGIFQYTDFFESNLACEESHISQISEEDKMEDEELTYKGNIEGLSYRYSYPSQLNTVRIMSWDTSEHIFHTMTEKDGEIRVTITKDTEDSSSWQGLPRILEYHTANQAYSIDNGEIIEVDGITLARGTYQGNVSVGVCAKPEGCDGNYIDEVGYATEIECQKNHDVYYLVVYGDANLEGEMLQIIKSFREIV